MEGEGVWSRTSCIRVGGTIGWRLALHCGRHALPGAAVVRVRLLSVAGVVIIARLSATVSTTATAAGILLALRSALVRPIGE